MRRKHLAQICKLRALGYTQVEISQRLNISQTAVSENLRYIRKITKIVGEDEAFNRILELLGYDVNALNEVVKDVRGNEALKGGKQ